MSQGQRENVDVRTNSDRRSTAAWLMVGTLLPSEGKGENSASLAQESNDAYQPIVDKPIIKPSVPFQRSFMSWCYRLFIREPLGYEAETTVLRDSDGLWRQFLPFLVSDFLKVPLRAFLITYGFDGFDLTRSEITYPDRDKPEPLKGWQFDKWLLVASFFGLPTRPEAFEDGGKITPKLTFKQLMKNFIGGWTPLYHYNEQKQRVWDLNEKGIWRLVVALTLKIFVILPLKILAIPIKTLMNIVKLFSEFLPMILIPCVRMLVNLALLIAFGIPTLISGGLAFIVFDLFRENSGGVRIFLIFLLGPTLFIPGGLIAGSCIVVGGAIWAALNAVLRIIPLVLRAITSPEKSARMALAFGRELKLSIFGVKVGNIVGVIGAAISIAISIVAWTIAFPLAIGAIVSVFPVALQAVVVWVANLPVVGAFLSSVYASLQMAGLALGIALQPVLGAVFGPILGFISTFLGLNLSATVVMVGTTLGMLSVSVGVMASGMADGLSDWWASRGARSYVHDWALKPNEGGSLAKANLLQRGKQPESPVAGALVAAKESALCKACGHRVNTDGMALRVTETVTHENTTRGGLAAAAHQYGVFPATLNP